ncbi:MAG: hypothetical protein ACJAYD_000064 [Patiriisocius sp.]|jgi:hypothetical protein
MRKVSLQIAKSSSNSGTLFDIQKIKKGSQLTSNKNLVTLTTRASNPDCCLGEMEIILAKTEGAFV